MTKRMRELQDQIKKLHEEATGYMAEGENKNLDKATELFDEADELQKEFDLEARKDKAQKAQAAAADPGTGIPGASGEGEGEKVDGFKAMSKMLNGKALSDAEKAALVTGTNSEQGESYLIPEDVKTEINELRKTYISAKELVTVEPTDSLTGAVNYEAGSPTGLTSYDDGDAIAEEDGMEFVRKTFTIGFHGKLIPVSRILLGSEKSGLLGYINRWFIKNAILTENADIFATLKAGYNGGTPKAVAGWKAFKHSITVDLDPSCLLGGVIATNQSGFAALDAEEDKDGKPILQPNPADPTQKLFQGLPIKVYPDAQLANIDATHFPMIYGNTKAGATFVEHTGLEFATSEHYGFNKRQNYMRVTEGFDVMSTDTSTYIYGSFSATPAVG